MNELMIFWKELKKKSVVTINDIEKLEKMLGKVFIKMQELEKSRNKWKERALNGKR